MHTSWGAPRLLPVRHNVSKDIYKIKGIKSQSFFANHYFYYLLIKEARARRDAAGGARARVPTHAPQSPGFR